MHRRLEPKLVTVLREGYSKKTFFQDLTAGITVGVVALPLAIAFAIASGVKPEQGLYTAIVAGFVTAALGGSRAQISGPTGAFIVVVYGIVQQYGYSGLAIATLIGGFLMILMGAAGMGAILRFIPYPVIVGFTSGIALIIFSSQIRDFLGLQMTSVPADFLSKWAAYAGHIGSLNLYALGIGAAAIVLIRLMPRISPRIPGPLVAILVTTAAVYWLHLPVETIGSRFGSVPSHFPTPQFPHLSLQVARQLFQPAVTIAFLGSLESLLAAVVADGMLGTRHRSNMELIAQGTGNIASVFFGGIPSTGAIARTATNIKSGGRTPVAAIIHCVTLALILVFVGKWAALIPMASLAGVLIVVAYNMSEWHAFAAIFKSTRSDVVVLLATFFITVVFDLTAAIQVGVLLAAFFFIRRMSNETQFEFITKELRERDEGESRDMSAVEIPSGVEVFEIYGSLFFGAVERFKDAIRRIENPPKVMIIRMRHVTTMDATGLRVLEELVESTSKNRTRLILSAVAPQPMDLLRHAGIVATLGEENIQPDIFHAINRAKEIMSSGTV